MLKGGPFNHTPNLTSDQLKYIPLTEFVRPQEAIIYISRPLDLESINRIANCQLWCGSLMTCCLCLPVLCFSRSMSSSKARGSVVVVTDRTLYYHQLDMPYCGCCSVQSSTKSIPLEQIQDITVQKRGTAINSSYTADVIEVSFFGFSSVMKGRSNTYGVGRECALRTHHHIENKNLWCSTTRWKQQETRVVGVTDVQSLSFAC